MARSKTVVWGGVLVVAGVVSLLANLDVNIRWDLLVPIFVILIGVWLIVARIGPGGGYAVGDRAEAREGIDKATLDLAVGAGRVQVRSATLGGDQLYTAHVEQQGGSPDVRLDRGTCTLKISTRLDWIIGARRLRVDAQLSDAVAWHVRCATGAIRGEFDLSTAPLSGFDCRTGASQISITLPPPKGVVPLHIVGGAMRVDLVRPAGSALKVQAEGGALRLQADGTGQDGFGIRGWRSAGFDAAADRYEVSLAGGALDVNISTR